MRRNRIAGARWVSSAPFSMELGPRCLMGRSHQTAPPRQVVSLSSVRPTERPVVADVLADLEHLKRTYGKLSEFAGVFAAIDSAAKTLATS